MLEASLEAYVKKRVLFFKEPDDSMFGIQLTSSEDATRI
jgi:hypothetical protein